MYAHNKRENSTFSLERLFLKILLKPADGLIEFKLKIVHTQRRLNLSLTL